MVQLVQSLNYVSCRATEEKIHEVSILVEAKAWYKFYDPRGPRMNVQDCHCVIPCNEHLIEIASGLRNADIMYKDPCERKLVTPHAAHVQYPQLGPRESYIIVEVVEIGVLIYPIHPNPKKFVLSDCISVFQKMVDQVHKSYTM